MKKVHTMEPVKELRTAVERFGVPEVSKRLGLGGPSLHDIIKKGECRPAYNLAARTMLETDTRPRILVCHCPAGADVKVARKLLETLGIKTLEFTE